MRRIDTEKVWAINVALMEIGMPLGNGDVEKTREWLIENAETAHSVAMKLPGVGRHTWEYFADMYELRTAVALKPIQNCKI